MKERERKRNENLSRFSFVMKNRDDGEKERKVRALVFYMCIIIGKIIFLVF